MNSIKSFKITQAVISILCLLLPVFLRIADNGNSFRLSISNYVYMQRSYVFGMLLSMAAMLFIFNATVYYQDSKDMDISKHGKWYNVVLGGSLLGVILFPHLQYAAIHYTFAGIFFLGNALVIGFFHRKRDEVISIILALLVVFTLSLHLFGFVTLLVGEWLSLATIGVHFILQSIGIVSINMLKHE